MGAYTQEAVVCSRYGCLYSWGTCSQWVSIPNVRYFGMLDSEFLFPFNLNCIGMSYILVCHSKLKEVFVTVIEVYCLVAR